MCSTFNRTSALTISPGTTLVVSYFGFPVTVTGSGHVDINVTAITLDFLFRLPFSQVMLFRTVGLQPYLTVGPGLFITEVKGEIEGEINGQPFSGSRNETDA